MTAAVETKRGLWRSLMGHSDGLGPCVTASPKASTERHPDPKVVFWKLSEAMVGGRYVAL
ncbi:MAG: hypothetical protein NVSMB62_16810 [Acidobacteriaceae bacterium]